MNHRGAVPSIRLQSLPTDPLSTFHHPSSVGTPKNHMVGAAVPSSGSPAFLSGHCRTLPLPRELSLKLRCPLLPLHALAIAISSTLKFLQVYIFIKKKINLIWPKRQT